MESGNDEATSRVCYFLRLVTIAVMAVGVLITLLSAAMLILSIFLLLQKNRGIISDLSALGYTPGKISRFYIMMVAALNLGALLMAASGIIITSQTWHLRLEALGFSPAGTFLTLAAVTGASLLLTVIGCASITAVVRRICR